MPIYIYHVYKQNIDSLCHRSNNNFNHLKKRKWNKLIIGIRIKIRTQDQLLVFKLLISDSGLMVIQVFEIGIWFSCIGSHYILKSNWGQIFFRFVSKYHEFKLSLRCSGLSLLNRGILSQSNNIFNRLV